MRRTAMLLLLVACDAPPTRPARQDDAWARIDALTPDGPSGVARFRRTPRGTRVVVQLDGLEPGAFGLHVREGADCADPGPHFDPTRTVHGGPLGAPATRHVGDLGNIVQDWHDVTRYHLLDGVIALDGTASIVGHPLVVTAERDDLVTDPDGGAHTPIACGLVTAVR